MSTASLETALTLRAHVEQFTSAVQSASADFRRAMGDIEGSAGEAGTATTEAGRGATELGQAAAAAAGDVGQLGQAAGGTAGQARTLGEAFGEVKAVLAAAVVALGGVTLWLGNAASKSTDFGRAMAEVSTLLDDTSAIPQLTEDVRRLSREFGGDVQRNTKALYDIVSAGAADATAAVDTLTASNKLAIGGVTDVGVAADGLTSTMNAYGEAAGSATAVSDAFFTAVKAGKTTVGELAGSIGQVAPIAAQAGVGLEELLASVATLTTGGVQTGVAMTQVRAAISSVIKPSAEAQQLAAELGIQFDAAALKSKGLAGFLDDVARATGGNTEQMAQLFGSVEALGAVLALTGTGAEKFGKVLAGMEQRAGATDAAVGKMMDTPAARAARFSAAINDVQLSVGDAVTAFSPLLEALTGTINLFNNAPGPVKTTIAAVTGISLAVPPVVVALAALKRAWDTIIAGTTAAAGTTATAARANTAAGVTAGAAVPGVNALAAAQSRLATASTGVASAAGLMRTTLGIIGWGLVATEVYDVAKNLLALRREMEATREASASLAETQGRVANRLREISESTGVAVTSMDEFNAAVKAGRLVFDQATASWRAGETALHDVRSAADQIGVATNALAAAMQADFDAGRIAARALADELLAAAGQGDEAAKAVGKLIESVDLASPAAVAALSDAIAIVRGESEAAAKVVDGELERALSELSATDLTAFGASLKAAFDAGQLGSIEFARVNDEVLNESFKRLGLDAEKALGRITPATADAIAALDGIRATLANTGDDAAARMTALGQAITAAVTRADTIEGLKALRAKIVEMGEAGELAGDAMQRALDEVDQQIRGLEIQLDPVEQAFKRLGITSTAELKRIADQAEADFRTIQQSGTATTRELAQGFTRYAQAAANANEGVVSDAVKAEAAVRGLKVETDAAGTVIVEAMTAGARAAGGLKQTVGEVREEMTGLQKEAQETQDLFDKWRQDTAKSRQGSGPVAAADFSDLLSEAESAGGTALRERLEGQLRSWIAASNMASVRGTYSPGIGSADDMRKSMQAAIIAAEQDAARQSDRDAARSRGGSQSLATNPMQLPTRHEVAINFGDGQRRVINTASPADSQALVGTLQELRRRSTA